MKCLENSIYHHQLQKLTVLVNVVIYPTLNYFEASKKYSIMSLLILVLFIYMSGNICCCCSVTKTYPTCCNPMDYSTPGSPTPYYYPEFAQILVH